MSYGRLLLKEKAWYEPTTQQMLKQKFLHGIWLPGKQRLQKLAVENPPVIISGHGGSATRLVAALLKKNPDFSLLFSSPDSLDSYSYRLSGLADPRLISDILRETRSLDYGLEDLSPPVLARVEAAHHVLRRLIDWEGFVANRLWGWKEPRSMYILPFFDKFFKNFKLIHIVRHPGSIRMKHLLAEPEMYEAYFGYKASEKAEIFFMNLWAATNEDVYHWGLRRKKGYFLLRVEDILAGGDKMKTVLEKLFDFLEVPMGPFDRYRKLLTKTGGINNVLVPENIRKTINLFGY